MRFSAQIFWYRRGIIRNFLNESATIKRDPDELLYIYKERSIVLGKEVTFQLDGKLKKGLAKEISESGRLQVEFEDKHTIWLNSGEISLTNW